MKRLYTLLAAAVLLLGFAGCSNRSDSSEAAEHEEIITEAISAVKEFWKDHYSSASKSDGYFEIKNTRIITVKENETELFCDVAYIVDFELFTDYYGSAPYYDNYNIYDNVVVYEDGTMEVTGNLIQIYRSWSYQTDYSDFIESIYDYQHRYNTVETLK